VLAQYISQHFLETGNVIAWEQILDKADAPLKVIRRKRKKAESHEENEELKKQPKKAKARNLLLFAFRRK